MFTSFYRLYFFCLNGGQCHYGAAFQGPCSGGKTDSKFCENSSIRNATEGWLGLGLRLGLIKENDARYSLRGFLTRKLVAPENDAIRALVREVASLHHLYIMQTPLKLEQGFF